MYCNYCGKQISDDSRFCPECGKEIKSLEPKQEQAEYYEQQSAPVSSKPLKQKKRKSKKIIVILFFVVIIYGVGCTLINLGRMDSSTSETSQTTAEAFAEENGISVELAEDLEDVLSKTKLDGGVKHHLSSVKGWKQIDNWANGERYGAQLDLKNVYFFYVKDNKIVGIRDDSGNYYYQVNTYE